jgi:hypothetical protein
MAEVEHTSDTRVLVGIDISKHRHEVLIAVPRQDAPAAQKPQRVAVPPWGSHPSE